MTDTNHSAARIDVRTALLMSSGALQILARDCEHLKIQFTGDHAGLGTHTVGAILDMADAALIAG